GDNGQTFILGGNAVLKQLGARPASTIILNDSDGVVRHVPFEFSKLKSFGIVAAEIASGHTISAPGTNNVWIDYAGPPDTVRNYSFWRVLDKKVPPSAFANKVVVIGASASSLQDYHPTPYSAKAGAFSGTAQMPGPEIQANVIETSLKGFPLRSVWFGWTFVL